jgi:uncharacterized coiled-coil DUF342 family protein
LLTFPTADGSRAAAKTIDKLRRERDILKEQLRDGSRENESLHKSVQTLSTRVDELDGSCKGLEIQLSQVNKEHEEKCQAQLEAVNQALKGKFRLDFFLFATD